MSDVKIGMSQRIPLEAVCSENELNRWPTEKRGAQLDIPGLNALALRFLVTLFDEKARLFSRSLTLGKDGFQRESTSPRRTLIALLGLQRLEESGETVPFDVSLMRSAVLGDTSWVRSLGDLGLLTWFTAECEPDRLRNLFSEFNFGSAIDNYWDGRQAQTRGLAWFLTGVAKARLTDPQSVPDLIDVAVNAYHLLEDNHSDNGIFGHAALPEFLRRTFCKRFGTFSDQIYSIYALVAFAEAFQIEEPLQSALNCGNAIRALQGELGQWWFLYDKRSCRVVNRYPLLSVHQGGTAPVGLLALGEATGLSFEKSVYKGLSWIMGENDPGRDTRNRERILIWDSIQPRRRVANYCEAVLSLVHAPAGPRKDQLRIRYGARPDHFGWLLYAFGELGLPRAGCGRKATL